jgi:carboxypeptidase T
MSTPRNRRLWRPLLAATAAATVGLAMASVPGAVATNSGTSHVRDQTMYTIAVRASDGDGAALAQRLIAGGFDLLEMRTGSVVYVLGPATTAAQLSRVGGLTVVGLKPAAPTGPIPKAPANQDDILPKKLDGKKYDTYYGGYRTTTAYDKFESDLQKAYPTLVKKIEVGKTWTGKNTINAVCLTEDADKGCKLTPKVDKPRFLVMAQIHAREVATSETTWRYMTRLIDGWKKDAQITALLQSTEIWVVPQFNIDGIQFTERGLEKDGTGSDSSAWQRKNRDDDQAPDGCPPPWANSQVGVDLNRNFDTHWDSAGVSHDPCSEVFNGKKAASEPETQELSGFFRTLFKDQRGRGDDAKAPKNTTGAMVTIHTVAGLVLFPWGTSATFHTPNDAQLRSLGFRQSYFNGFETGQPPEVLYATSGTTDDWTYDDLGIASYTWELDGVGGCGGTFFPLYTCMDDYEKNNLPGLYYDAAAARTPYKLGLGPTVVKVSAKGSGGKVTVTATADDNAYGSSGVGRPEAQKVTEARIYVGTAPWDGGKAQDMKIKGNGTDVTATATVKAGSKKVLAYVQAKDKDGNWGPAVAVWIPAR